MRKTKATAGNQGTTEKCKVSRSSLGRLNHLSEKEIDKLIEEEPGITVKEYLAFLFELNEIQNGTGTKSPTRREIIDLR